MTVLVQVAQLNPSSPVRLFFVCLKTPASHHSSHELLSMQDRSVAKMPALRPAIAFAEEVRCYHHLARSLSAG
jgi:hypothetical protein